MTTPLHAAARALVDAVDWWDSKDRFRAPVTEVERRYRAMVEAVEPLRALLASPSPSPAEARDAALEEAARVVDTYASEAQNWFRETSESRWTTRLAARLRSLKSQPAPPARDERAEADAADIALTEAGADLAATVAFAAAVQCVADYKDEIAQRHLYPGRTEQLTALHEVMERLRALAEFAAACAPAHPPESVEAPPAHQHNEGKE